MIGRLIMTPDLNYIPAVISSGPTKVIWLTDNLEYETSEGYATGNDTCGSILLPPYSIMCEVVDDRFDINFVKNRYLEYLHTREPLSFVCGILGLLIKGLNVMIMVNKIERDFNFIPETLFYLFQLRYGITPETMSNPFIYPNQDMYLDTIYSDLYLFDYMDESLLRRLHSQHPFNDEVQTKIMNSNNFRVRYSQEPVNPFINMNGNGNGG